MEKFPAHTFDELQNELTEASRLTIVNGYLHLPEGPGWGVELNPDILEKVPYVTTGPWKIS